LIPAGFRLTSSCPVGPRCNPLHKSRKPTPQVPGTRDASVAFLRHTDAFLRHPKPRARHAAVTGRTARASPAHRHPARPRRTGRHPGMPASPLCDTSDANMRRQWRQYASAAPPRAVPLPAAISGAAPPGPPPSTSFPAHHLSAHPFPAHPPGSSPARPGGVRPPCGAGRACSTIRDSVKPWLAKG
jgi:hypothetical protein